MLSSRERKILLDFLEKHADGDILILAANRVASNLNDTETLRNFIKNYKMSPPHPEDFLSDKGKSDEEEAPAAKVEDEDLGPAPSRLGANGQAIAAFLTEHINKSYTVDEICKATKLKPAIVKPMLALLLEREQVVREGHNRYMKG